MKEKLEETKFACESLPMSVGDALACAAEYIRKSDARILAETPERIIWQAWNKNERLDPLLKNCLKLYIFDADAEIRLQREYNSPQGFGRIVYKDDGEKPALTRFSYYMLKGSRKMLKYAEHFDFDPKSGAISLKFARFCGVEEKGNG